MEKRLVSVGNGLALFIDKTMQKLLMIDASTIVNVETDGIRLVIEPCGRQERKRQIELQPWMAPAFKAWSGAETEQDLRVAYHASATHQALWSDGMTEEHFRSLYQGRLANSSWSKQPPSHSFYSGRLIQPQGLFAGPQDLATMHRLAACLGYRRDGLSWDEAVAAALEQVPLLEALAGSVED